MNFPILSIQQLSKDIPDDYIDVLKALTDGEYVYPVAYVSDHLGMNIKTVQKIVQRLKFNNLVTYGHLTQEDSVHLCGKGYWRNSRGDELLDLLRLEGRI